MVFRQKQCKLQNFIDMISFILLKRKALDHVRNPIFDKPIPLRNYEKNGSVKLITKIRTNEKRA